MKNIEKVKKTLIILINRIKCNILDHLYLPYSKIIELENNNWKVIEYLKCFRCEKKYYFAMNEWWHLDNDKYYYHRAWDLKQKMDKHEFRPL